MVHPNAESLRSREDVYQWYTAEIKSIPPAARELFEKYSGVPAGQVVSHVSKVRDRAFCSWPYPCIGQLRFLNLVLQKHPLYPSILSRLTQENQTLLDAGCCFGQELRKLAFDGVPPKALYGLDLEADFINLGYDLFCDRATMSDATFIAGSLLDETASFPQLGGKIDIINANSLFHLFTWEEQITVTSRLISFMKDRPGSMILGRQVGAVEAGEYRALNEGATTYRHNVDSFRRLWKEVEGKTGSKWEVAVRQDMEDVVQGVNLGQKWMNSGTKRLHFIVTRRHGFTHSTL